jgi:hypothetical protein
MDYIRRLVRWGTGDPSGGQMSDKALDLRTSTQIVRRHKFLVGFVVVLGILGGAAYAVLKPPMLTSTALVALQEPASVQQSANNNTTAGGTDTFTATQKVVAGSYPVLLDALPHVRPAMSFDELFRYHFGKRKRQERRRRRSNRQRCG